MGVKVNAHDHTHTQTRQWLAAGERRGGKNGGKKTLLGSMRRREACVFFDSGLVPLLTLCMYD
jgi:hypothetical protein